MFIATPTLAVSQANTVWTQSIRFDTSNFSNISLCSRFFYCVIIYIIIFNCRILHHFNTNPDEYSVVFTSGATAALKLVAESFTWTMDHQESFQNEWYPKGWFIFTFFGSIILIIVSNKSIAIVTNKYQEALIKHFGTERDIRGGLRCEKRTYLYKMIFFLL